MGKLKSKGYVIHKIDIDYGKDYSMVKVEFSIHEEDPNYQKFVEATQDYIEVDYYTSEDYNRLMMLHNPNDEDKKQYQEWFNNQPEDSIWRRSSVLEDGSCHHMFLNCYKRGYIYNTFKMSLSQNDNKSFTFSEAITNTPVTKAALKELDKLKRYKYNYGHFLGTSYLHSVLKTLDRYWD